MQLSLKMEKISTLPICESSKTYAHALKEHEKCQPNLHIFWAAWVM